MNKQEIKDRNLKIHRRYNSIHYENKILETLKSLIKRSEENISYHREKIDEEQTSIVDTMLSELRSVASASALKLLFYGDNEADRLFEKIRRALIDDFPSNGFSAEVAESEVPKRFNVEKFKNMFQVLLDKYINTGIGEPPAYIIISTKNKNGVFIISLYDDNGI